MKKILIVEDEKNIVLSLKMLLKKQGYSVLTAYNGADAIKLVQQNLPDLVLLDIIIPIMNGYIVCEAIKEDDNTKAIPVIIMSAKNQEEDIKRALSAGANDYIIKPFTPDEILKAIKKYIKEEE